MDLVEIRCPGRRKHTIKSCIYETCGNIMGGVMADHECETVFHCNMCGFWRVIVDEDGNIQIEKIDTSNGKRINFIKKWRMCHNV